MQLGPYSYLTPSISTSAVFFSVLLLPQIAMLFFTESYSSVLIIIQTVLASVAGEFLFQVMTKKGKRTWLIAVIQGVLVGLLVPSTYPPAAVFLICFVSFILAKYTFGGFASSWINPVAFTIAMLYLLCPDVFPSVLINPQQLRVRNAALNLIQNGDVRIVPADSSVTHFLNAHIFSLFGISIPDGYVSLFWDNSSIIPAFRFNLITIISSMVLVSFDIIDAVIPGIFITVYILLVKIFSPLPAGGSIFAGDVLLSLLTSGTLFCTTYLLQWYGTTPVTSYGKTAYGIIAGLTAFCIMGFGTSSTGYIFTILLMNFISPIIQYVEEHSAIRLIKKNLVPKINALKEIDNVQL